MRGQNTAGHPGRQVHKARFGIGDIVHHPEYGPITIEALSGRYFSGRRAGGETFGKTSIGLTRGESMSGPPAPWRVERQ